MQNYKNQIKTVVHMLFVVVLLCVFKGINDGGHKYILISTGDLFACLFLVAEIIFLIRLVGFFLKKDTKNIIICIIEINVLSFIALLNHDRLFISKWLCIVVAIMYLGISGIALLLIWKNRNKESKKFICALLVSCAVLIVNYAGTYDFIYNAYAPFGPEPFERENGNWIFAQDFIWFSSQQFFGTDISDVSLKPVSYNEMMEDEIASKYYYMYEETETCINWLRLLASLESLIFIFYISIIVLEARDAGKTETSS